MTKLLSKKQVRELISLSFTQIDRLEKLGKFPKRIRLGQSRVAWIADEVEKWIQDRILTRSTS